MESSSEIIRGRATICITNYKTLDLTRICLRSIRKFTSYPCDVGVGDNDSKDLQGLRDLSQLRTFLSGQVVPVLFDVPLAPLYIVVVYLIHPQASRSR